MKKRIIYTLIGGVLCFGQTPTLHAAADTPEPTEPPHILIAEIQTGGASEATEEFVELYNPTDAEVDVTGWQLQYRAASGAATQTWAASSTKATFACPTASPPGCRVLIAPGNRIVVTHTIANIAGALPMNGGFSGTGGQIRLVQPGTPAVVHDFVGYGTAAHAETAPAPAPANGKSIKRIVDDGDTLTDTQNNAADFIAACGDPTPGLGDTHHIPRANGCEDATTTSPDPDLIPGEEPDSQPTDSQDTENQPGQGAGTPVYLPVIITEVFADPASPQQDSTDEFIELYNPNDSAITLKAYRLQTGNDFRYTYTLGDTPLGPRMYLAIPSAVSKLSLANSGSGVRLLDPNSAVAYETPNYGVAKEGQSWMQDDSGWKWTLTPTPGAANVMSVPQPKAAAASATPKKKAATKTTTPKTTAAKQPKAPAVKKTTTEQQKAQPPQQAASAAANPQYWLLVPLGTLAAGYAAYEYRHGISRAARTGWAKVSGKEPPAKE